MTMTFSVLLSGCRHPGGEWFEQNDIQKVIDGLKEIPAGKRTPELAKVHISVAEIGEAGQELYEIKIYRSAVQNSVDAALSKIKEHRNEASRSLKTAERG